MSVGGARLLDLPCGGRAVAMDANRLQSGRNVVWDGLLRPLCEPPPTFRATNAIFQLNSIMTMTASLSFSTTSESASRPHAGLANFHRGLCCLIIHCIGKAA